MQNSNCLKMKHLLFLETGLQEQLKVAKYSVKNYSEFLTLGTEAGTGWGLGGNYMDHLEKLLFICISFSVNRVN